VNRAPAGIGERVSEKQAVSGTCIASRSEIRQVGHEIDFARTILSSFARNFENDQSHDHSITKAAG